MPISAILDSYDYTIAVSGTSLVLTQSNGNEGPRIDPSDTVIQNLGDSIGIRNERQDFKIPVSRLTDYATAGAAVTAIQALIDGLGGGGGGGGTSNTTAANQTTMIAALGDVNTNLIDLLNELKDDQALSSVVITDANDAIWRGEVTINQDDGTRTLIYYDQNNAVGVPAQPFKSTSAELGDGTLVDSRPALAGTHTHAVPVGSVAYLISGAVGLEDSWIVIQDGATIIGNVVALADDNWSFTWDKGYTVINNITVTVSTSPSAVVASTNTINSFLNYK